MSNFRRISTVIIGAGHAGLSFSRKLKHYDIEHVILERGEIANSWKKERWDSLTLLTPKYKFNLPNYRYTGQDPQGFMDKSDVINILQQYAQSSNAPVKENTSVIKVDKENDGYMVYTNKGTWLCQAIVLANGAFGLPVYPLVAKNLPNNIKSIHSQTYKNPDQLPAGKVLVVGASSSGLQIADELNKSGFDVTISIGNHVRIPRTYRGKDIFWWLDKSGISAEESNDLAEIKRLQKLPSPQLVGNKKIAILDINYLQNNGVNVVGKLAGINNGDFQFSGALNNICKLADLKLKRLLKRFEQLELSDEEDLTDPIIFDTTIIPPLKLSMKYSEFTTVIWATGLKPDYSWLHVPVLDNKGNLVHANGVVASDGMYALGLPSMIKRQSSYIHGIESDVDDLSKSLVHYLDKFNLKRRYA